MFSAGGVVEGEWEQTYLYSGTIASHLPQASTLTASADQFYSAVAYDEGTFDQPMRAFDLEMGKL